MRRLKDWIAAIAIGIMIPAFLFSVADKLLLPKKIHQDDFPTEETISRQEDAGDSNLIPVLLVDGTCAYMEMDMYLTGVVLAEMPADFEMEALKAQAVVARTYALKCALQGSKHADGAVCVQASCCQAYRTKDDYLASGGNSAAVEKVECAVMATSGQILTFEGELIEATYFSCSGGRTEEAAAVWGTEVPYLQAVDSPGEENAKYFFDIVSFSAAEFADALDLAPTTEPSDWFSNTVHTTGGGVDTICICGEVFKGTDLRKKLSLRSTAFTISVIDEVITVTTKGYGHRVGMSQYGADAMALSGKTYIQILEHYYPGTILETYLQN